MSLHHNVIPRSMCRPCAIVLTTVASFVAWLRDRLVYELGYEWPYWAAIFGLLAFVYWMGRA